MKKIFLLLFILFAQICQAQTPVSGGIFANTSWTVANSPYVLTGPIVVFPGNTLTIEPGVTVKVQFKGFNTGLMSYIELRGNMIANGTKTAPIRFEAELPTQEYTWRGIEIKSVQGGSFTGAHFELQNALYGIGSDKIYYDTLSFKHCSFKNNMFGIYLVANLKLDSCSFVNNGAAVTAMPSYGGVDVNQCTFEENNVCFPRMANGIFIRNSQFLKGKTAILECTGKIENCLFQENQIGLENCYELVIQNSLFQRNGSAIIGANQCTIEQNLILANTIGIEFAGPCTVVNNDINVNEVGVKISGAFSPGQTVQNFNENRLCYNTKYNVENGSDLNLGLEKNCFCLQDSAAIEALIYDGYDDFTRGLINFATYDTACVQLLTTYKKVQINTSLAEQSINPSIQIYPNPANTFLYIQQTNQTEFVEKLQIIDVMGRTLGEITLNRNEAYTLDVSNYAGGMYWIKTADNRFHDSFVIATNSF